MAVRLVQFSDLHLGRSFGGLALPDEVCDQLAQASLDAVRRACELSRERAAAALLIPGDMFDRPEVDEELIRCVQTLFGELQRPVLVSPGNHDNYGAMSVWNNAALEKLGLERWPENVHIFSTRTLTPRKLLDGELAVYGHRVEGYHSASDSPLTGVEIARDARWNVLLVHGALEGIRWDRRTTVPFTTRQLAEIGADYAAVGHYHRFRRIEHENRLLGAYGGVPVPGEINEDPHGGLLVVTLQDGGPEVEYVEVYPGRITRLTLSGDPPFRDTDDAAVRIRRAAGENALDQDDIVFARLDGTSEQPLDPELIQETLQGHFRHVVVRDETEPPYPDLPSVPAGRTTIESQFAVSLRRQIESCEGPQRRAALESALKYGLLALRGRTIRPPAAVDEYPGAESHDAD